MASKVGGHRASRRPSRLSGVEELDALGKLIVRSSKKQSRAIITSTSASNTTAAATTTTTIADTNTTNAATAAASIPIAVRLSAHGASGPRGYRSIARAGVPVVFTYGVGGSGLDTRSGKDAAIVVPVGTCGPGAMAAGGSSALYDLGPDNAQGKTSVSASMTFVYAGTYDVCYRLFGYDWVKVGSSISLWPYLR